VSADKSSPRDGATHPGAPHHGGNYHFCPLFALHKLPVPVYEDPCYGQKDQPLDWLLARSVIPLDIKINNFRPKLAQLIALAIHDARFSPQRRSKLLALSLP
jgi:hypothetical protein